MKENPLTGLIGAFMKFLDVEKEDDGANSEMHRAELEEFFCIRDLECQCCEYSWTAMCPLELEIIFEAKLECPSCGMNAGVINDKSHTRKTE
jgi:hypothetical protein